jgi:hypothetical protein
MVAALLCDDAGAAELLELAAAKFDSNVETRGIANMLRDRASDLRLQHRPASVREDRC